MSHTGQIFFPESTSTRVFKTGAYREDQNQRTYLAEDRVYTEQGGARTMVKLTGVVASGLQGVITLAVDRSASR